MVGRVENTVILSPSYLEVWQSWFNAAVLKTVVLKGTIGSNPIASAKLFINLIIFVNNVVLTFNLFNMEYNLEDLRKKFNKGTIEDQKKASREFLEAMNPGVKVFSTFPPVDHLTKEEEDHIREGILEANKLRNEGKL